MTSVAHLRSPTGLLLILAALGAASSAQAVLIDGQKAQTLSQGEMPEQLCAVVPTDAEGSWLGICSATVVGAQQLITAAHCTQPVEDQVRTEIYCRNGVRALVTKAVADSKLDLALMKVDRDLGIPPMRIVDNAQQRDELLDSSRCVLAGFGTDPVDFSNIPKAGAFFDISTPTTLVNPHVRFDKGILVVEREGGVLVNLGDSGGGFYCKDVREEWHLLGVNSQAMVEEQASGAAIPIQGFIADLTSASKWLWPRLKPAEPTLAARAETLRTQTEAIEGKLSNCRRLLLTSYSDFFKAVDPISTHIEVTRETGMKALRDQAYNPGSLDRAHEQVNELTRIRGLLENSYDQCLNSFNDLARKTHRYAPVDSKRYFAIESLNELARERTGGSILTVDRNQEAEFSRVLILRIAHFRPLLSTAPPPPLVDEALASIHSLLRLNSTQRNALSAMVRKSVSSRITSETVITHLDFVVKTAMSKNRLFNPTLLPGTFKTPQELSILLSDTFRTRLLVALQAYFQRRGARATTQAERDAVLAAVDAATGNYLAYLLDHFPVSQKQLDNWVAEAWQEAVKDSNAPGDKCSP